MVGRLYFGSVWESFLKSAGAKLSFSTSNFSTSWRRKLSTDWQLLLILWISGYVKVMGGR